MEVVVAYFYTCLIIFLERMSKIMRTSRAIDSRSPRRRLKLGLPEYEEGGA
jgi:hypothetical protein